MLSTLSETWTLPSKQPRESNYRKSFWFAVGKILLNCNQHTIHFRTIGLFPFFSLPALTLTTLLTMVPLSLSATHLYPVLWMSGRYICAGKGGNHSDWLCLSTSLSPLTTPTGDPASVSQDTEGVGLPWAEQSMTTPVVFENVIEGGGSE